MADSKIVKINELTALCIKLRTTGRKIVLCHGCFDFLHLGHLRHFKAARKHGDVLIVTVTPDAYVNKGPGRPFYKVEERIELIAALETVDYVCINPWPTAAETIGTIKPDKFVKGGEYRDGTAQQDARFQREVSELNKIGGEMIFTDEVTLSSTHIIDEVASDLIG